MKPGVEDSAYPEVRGLSRGLLVLRTLNTLPGAMAGVSELAKATGLHRTTVRRLLETLRAEGCVQRKEEGAVYTLAHDVRRLSEGYVAAAWIDSVAAPCMYAHSQFMSWPTDLATPDSGFMVVRESTHRLSLLSFHRASIGMDVPMLSTAIGRAWLAWCSDDERRATLAFLASRDDEMGEQARNTTEVRRLLRETRKRGYALNRGEWAQEPNVWSIALPIRMGQHAIAAINAIFQKGMVSEREIVTRYLPQLRTLADEISAGITGSGRG